MTDGRGALRLSRRYDATSRPGAAPSGESRRRRERARSSRPGVSRHLRILRTHGLVSSRVDGRRRVYSLDPGPLDDLDAWLTHYRAFWQNRLDALDTEVKRQRRNT